MKRISDAFLFAKEGRVLEGTLAISGLERLHDLLVEVSGDVSFRLQGFKSEHGELMLHIEVAGLLPLACQRCLKAISFDLDVDSLLNTKVVRYLIQMGMVLMMKTINALQLPVWLVTRGARYLMVMAMV